MHVAYPLSGHEARVGGAFYRSSHGIPISATQAGLTGSSDLVFPRHQAVIFVNGCFWHWHDEPDCPIAGLPKSNVEYWRPKLARTRIRDHENVVALIAAGWRVLIIWECQIRSPDEVYGLIREFLS